MRAIVPRHEIFQELDQLDQQQIVAAATGEVIDELIYQVKGRTAISWAGINHICFFMGDIGVNAPKDTQWERITMFGDRVYWSATIRARNDKYGLSSLGTAEAPELADTHVVDKDGGWVKNPDGSWKMTLREDPHCRRKALSMAQRNGKRAVIPAAVLAKWMGYFKKLKAGEKVEPPFRPKAVEAEYTVKNNREPSKRDPRPPTELRPREVSLGVLEYNLGAVNAQILDLVDIIEDIDGFSITPLQDLDDETRSFIDGTLKSMGGVWEGLLRRWRIPKEG